MTSPPVVTPTEEGVTPTAMPLPTLSVATPTPAPSSTPAASPTLTPVPNSPANTPSLPRPTLHGDPTLEELLELEEEFNRTDLEIMVIASPDPALVGEELVYTLTVINQGPNPASSTQVVATLPGASRI